MRFRAIPTSERVIPSQNRRWIGAALPWRGGASLHPQEGTPKAPRLRSFPIQLAGAFREAPEIDLGLALAAFIALLLNPVVSKSTADLSPAAGLLAVVTSAPLVLRRRYPLGVLAVVSIGVLACLAVFHPNEAAVAVVMLAIYTVGLEGRRVRSLFVGTAMAPVVAAAVAVTAREGLSLAPTVANLALILVALAAGDARRGRLALAKATREEAERERDAAILHQFDQQRLRVAHELHDTVAHALVAINVRAAAAAHLQREAPNESTSAVDEIKRTSADALAELRRTLGMLRSAADEAPLRPAQSLANLRTLVDGLQGAGLTVELRVGVIPDELPDAVGHAGYRIVQEALTNVLRHSSATYASVEVASVDGGLTVEVIDDGRSVGHHNPTAGHGLRGMTERAEALGGHCEAGPLPGRGWRVAAYLPVEKQVT